MKAQSLGASTAIISALQVLGMAAGLAVELAVAASFGLGPQADAYFLALAVPLFVQEVVTASVPQVLIPKLGRWQSQGRGNLASGVSLCYGLVLALASGALGGLFLALADGPLGLLGWPAWDQGRDLLLPLVIVACLWPMGQSLRALLNVQRRYVVANVDWAVMSVTALLALLAGHSAFGILALAWGQLLGTGLYIVLCLYLILRPGLRGVSVRQMVTATCRLLRPYPLPAGAAAASSIPMLVARVAVAALGPGSVAALSYAFRLRSSLERLLFAGLGTASLSGAASLGVGSRARSEVIAQSMALGIFLAVPVTALMVAGPVQLVDLVYVRGAFSAEDAFLASRLLPWYGIGLTVSALSRILQLWVVLRARLGWLLCLRLVAVAAEVSVVLVGLGLLGIAAPGVGWVVGTVLMCMGVWALFRSEVSGILRMAAASWGRSAWAGMIAMGTGMLGFTALPPGAGGTMATVLLCLLAYWITALLLGSKEASPRFWMGGLWERPQ